MITILSLPTTLAANPQPVRGSVSLSGQRYQYRLHWSPLAGWGAGAWLLDLSDATGAPIALAVPLVLSEDLWVGYRDDPRVPRGRLSVTRVTGEDLDPRADDVATAIRLSYES